MQALALTLNLPLTLTLTLTRPHTVEIKAAEKDDTEALLASHAQTGTSEETHDGKVSLQGTKKRCPRPPAGSGTHHASVSYRMRFTVLNMRTR